MNEGESPEKVDGHKKSQVTKTQVLDNYHMAGQARIKSEFVLKSDPHYRPEEIPIKESNEKNSPPPKKKRRGQNKNRPRNKQLDFDSRLCPSLVNDEGLCAFKGKCKFAHDIQKYVQSKPEDIGPNCYAFDTYGFCPYGVSCRFGKSHIAQVNDSYETTICEETKNKTDFPQIENVMKYSLRTKLRKNKVEYSKSDKILSEMKITSKFNSHKNQDGEITNCKQMGLEQLGILNDDDVLRRIGFTEKKKVDFEGKVMLAPLTTCGNLPFRVICKKLGADITCGEMAMATSLLQGNTSEWALVKRHPCEDLYGVQLCGAFPDSMTKCTELLNEVCDIDFIDVNMGCPIDLVYTKGGGSALMRRQNKLKEIIKGMVTVSNVPITVKMRTGVEKSHNTAHNILEQLKDSGIAMATVHGRSREARYTKDADWKYISECAEVLKPIPFYGNGDIYSYEEYLEAMSNGVSGVMIARGALIKPWLFTEIKEKKVWDISSKERLEIIQNYVNEGLMYWGSDDRGVETTRRFLLEWLSFLCRYVPHGILERPQKINERPPYFIGRNDIETLLSSPNCKDWVKISEMFLGKVPDGFVFLPKHKANSYN